MCVFVHNIFSEGSSKTLKDVQVICMSVWERGVSPTNLNSNYLFKNPLFLCNMQFALAVFMYSKEPPFLQKGPQFSMISCRKFTLKNLDFDFKTKFGKKNRERKWAASESQSLNDFFRSKQVHFWGNRTPPF